MARCTSETHLIVLNKKSYDRIKDRIYKKEMQIELVFYRQISELRYLNKRILMRIWDKHRIKNVKRNEVIIREGEPSKYVFIIKSGEF